MRPMKRAEKAAVVGRRTLLLAVAAFPGTALAQEYPSRPIQLIIPFAPGASADGVARVIATALGHRLRQTIVADNRAGGGGSLGLSMVVRAAPAFDYPQRDGLAISTPSSMSAKRDSPRQRTMMPGGGSRERPRCPPRRASLRM
jgi:tripartite-type tricarboxylate transporter receptor subunit TctC